MIMRSKRVLTFINDVLKVKTIGHGKLEIKQHSMGRCSNTLRLRLELD